MYHVSMEEAYCVSALHRACGGGLFAALSDAGKASGAAVMDAPGSTGAEIAHRFQRMDDAGIVSAARDVTSQKNSACSAVRPCGGTEAVSALSRGAERMRLGEVPNFLPRAPAYCKGQTAPRARIVHILRGYPCFPERLGKSRPRKRAWSCNLKRRVRQLNLCAVHHQICCGFRHGFGLRANKSLVTFVPMDGMAPSRTLGEFS
jgi:hypothetical protein